VPSGDNIQNTTMNDDDDPPSITMGYKHRINQLFVPHVAWRVREGVEYVHSIMCSSRCSSRRWGT